MARQAAEDKGAWNFREIPRGLMQRVKLAAAYEGKTVKQWLMDLAMVRLAEMEKKGNLPKGEKTETLLILNHCQEGFDSPNQKRLSYFIHIIGESHETTTRHSHFSGGCYLQ